MGKSTLDSRITRLRENLCHVKSKIYETATAENDSDWRLLYILCRYLHDPWGDETNAWFWRSIAESEEDPRKVSFAYRPEDTRNDERRRFCSIAKFLKGRARQHGATFTDEEADRIAFLVGTHSPSEKDWRFEECMGEELSEAYRVSPYWGSCMSGKYYFDMLENNPEKVSLVKIYRADEWVGRALLWTTDQGTRVLDRVYPSDEGAQVEAAWKWARTQEYDRRTNQCCGDAELWSGNNKHQVTLNVGSAAEFPYLDTFKYTDDNPREENCIVLNTTSGNYSFTETDGAFEGDNSTSTCHSCDGRVSEDDCRTDDDGYSFCGECYNERYVYLSYRHNGRFVEGEYRRSDCSDCPECNETRCDVHMIDVEGTFYCQDCAPDVATVCDECEEYILHDNLTECDGKDYCKDCLSNVSAECEECGIRHLTENMEHVDNLGPGMSNANREKYVCTECKDSCQECGEEKPLSSECRACASRTQLILVAV